MSVSTRLSTLGGLNHLSLLTSVYPLLNTACHIAGIQYIADQLKKIIELKSHLLWFPDARKTIVANFYKLLNSHN